jgi:pimeloyl-ACP methyl ester carboxylesterase
MSTTAMKPERVVTRSGYAPVNGLAMYYEIEGRGKPLVYVPPAFGYAGVKYFPGLNEIRTVITPDLQGHGRTADLPERPITFEQHAKDVVGLLRHLGVERADFLGESFGGIVATIISLRYPEVVGKVATYGATFASPTEAVKPEVLRGNAGANPESPGTRYQRENYKKVAADPEYWPHIWSKVVSQRWEGFTQAELASIEAPTLIALGDRDFVRLDHAMSVFNTIPNAELAVIPDATHFVLGWAQEKVIPVIARFLEATPHELPRATAETGFYPGKTR